MPNTSIDRIEQMHRWFQALVTILKEEEPFAYQILLETAPGKTAFFTLDNYRFQATMESTEPFTVTINQAGIESEANFSCSSEALRSIIAGQLTLDKAIASGNMFVRASFEDLLAMHRLIMNILADSPLSRRLQLLWKDFDTKWIPPTQVNQIKPLIEQNSKYGIYLDHIPESVLLAKA